MLINFHAIKTDTGWTVKKRYGNRDAEKNNVSDLDLIVELAKFEEELKEQVGNG